ncbi:DEAD/DEAH box helicase [Pseudalkalibacillus sp. SCS-8]|uniref:DEAD/DEAH box helicase n=1 Tax=Pseudalkalibacillus nanhaiensis TaxID=3115291 RepID=UPI0032DB2C6B
MFKEGLYEEVISQKLRESLTELEREQFDIGTELMDVEEARKKLAAYISYITRKALKLARDTESDDQEALLRQIRVCNEIISYLSTYLDDQEFQSLQIAEEGEILTSVYSKLNTIKSLKKDKPLRPVTPLSESSLFTGSNYEPNMLNELKKEILTSNEINMLVSFIKWSGLRCIMEELRDFTTRKNGRLRVITTSYMEATDFKAIMELSKLPNTEIKISYDIKRTRLHAKAYMFKRDTKFSTAYIGSSNLSNPALTSGLEWNVKITEKDSFDVMKKVDATFETYWNDEEFVTFNPEDENDRNHLRTTLKKSTKEETPIHFSFEIRPYHYQKEILENLQVEREVYGRNKNLLVAATGVGKTVISAFDYRRFVKEHGHPQRLLFVAHREEILKQSRDTFRAILQDLNFGDLLVGKEKPEDLDHLFISIQSFNSTKLYEKTTPDYYDFIIVDEFHHAAASSYQKLLDYYEPKILLGLTATPERMDGKSVLSNFDDRIAAEMRLTEAINRKLLSPFQYFCVTDEVDLSKLKWSRRGYDLRELENVYTHNTKRSYQVLKSIYKYVTDMDDVKGLGFCVGVDHAKYMAKFFNEQDVPSIALHGGTDTETRQSAKHRLLSGEIRFIFVADLYNEGVDLPEVNTVLFLRPTESLTVFLQQLGRGLRLAEDKECLTVLDFIGQAHKNYNFEEKFRALMGKTKHSVKHYVENGFSNLPKGSFIQLEKQAKEYILRNIKSTANTRSNLIQKMKYFQEDTGVELTLENFLNHYNLTLYDFYGKSGDRSFFRMKAEAGLTDERVIENEAIWTKRFPNLFHLDSKRLLEFYLRYIDGFRPQSEEEKLMVNMLYYSFYNGHPEKEGLHSIEEGLVKIFAIPVIKEEIRTILIYNYNLIKLLEYEHDFPFANPLGVHSNYTTAQVMASFGYFNEEKSPAFREGVKHFQEKNLDIFFITLNKSEKDFSPSTLYEDYAINERLFHWQSQSTVSATSKTAQRYIHHRENGHQIALFIREYKKENGYTSPFTFLGTADYVQHSGSKPMSITWRLRREMPPMLVPKANKNVL